MKALTLHQPWASAIAEGLKTIETRHWRTDWRGPLAIHAGVKKPDTMRLGDWWCEPTWDAEFGLLNEVGQPHRLPLGAVVAVARLVDVVPMVGPGLVVGPCVYVPGERSTAHPDPNGLWGWDIAEATGREYSSALWVDLTDQLPWGLYEPGRFAWLLADVHKLPEPIPAKGKQGLWEWQEAPVPA